MSNFIGVGEPLLIASPGTLKRAALVFDQIALGGVEIMQYLNRIVAREELSQQLSEFDWLVENGVIVRTPPHLSITPTGKDGVETVEKLMSIFMEISLQENPEKIESIFGERGREFAELIQGKVVDPELFTRRTDEAANSIVRKAAQRLRKSYGWDTVAFSLRGTPREKILTAGLDSVIDVVVSEFPEPDDSTPWEPIVAFRKDPDAKGKFIRLKKGSSRISLQQVSCSRRSDRRVAAGGARAEYRNFLESPPRPGGHSRKTGCLNGSIRGSRGESGHRARPAHRWLNGEHAPYPRRPRRRTEDREGSIPPDDAVNEACRRR